MNITVAIENNIPFNQSLPLVAEHGVAFLIETGGRRILYDTGQTGAVVGNLVALGVGPETIDTIVLSHGHHDHTGGLLAVLAKARPDVQVIAHPGLFGRHYSVGKGRRRPVGVPFAEEYVTARAGTWTASAEPLEIAPGLWFSGTIPRVTDFETGDARLVLAEDSGDRPDPLSDDTVLYWKGRRGLVVVGGCTHSGLVNAVLHGFTVTGLATLQGWVGGTHLGPVGADQQDRTIERLAAWKPEFVAANHCTGFPMMSRLKERFGERFIPAFTGERIAVE